VLSEEALILTGAFVACGLLVLGVLELLWPTQPRRRARVRPAARRPTLSLVSDREAIATSARAFASPLAVEPVVAEAAIVAPLAEPRIADPEPLELELIPAPLAAAEASVSIEAPVVASAGEEAQGHPRRVHRTSPLARHRLERGRTPYVRRTAAALEPPESPAELPLVIEPAPVAGPAALSPASLVERCFALHEAGRDDEVIVLGMGALEGQDGQEAPADAHETAALWSVIALARQALGENDPARVALETAIAVAPASDQPAYRRQLAALADGVATALLAEADAHLRTGSEERLAAVRSATEWRQRAATATPGDERLVDLVAASEAQLWSTYERTVTVCGQRQDFRSARRLLREALDDPRFPPARVEAFREMFSATFSGEIGQLTAQAIRSVQEGRESDALAALQRAESLLASLSPDVLSAKRREEVDRRMWWGYSKLGERRLSADECEAALEPLYNALDYEVGADLRRQTHELLAQALEGVAHARALRITGLLEAGDRDAAIVQCDRLEALLSDAVGRGVRTDDLDQAYGTVQRLMTMLGAVSATER
jgi:tetratricopeptide (TPR) repeat protein